MSTNHFRLGCTDFMNVIHAHFNSCKNNERKLLNFASVEKRKQRKAAFPPSLKIENPSRVVHLGPERWYYCRFVLIVFT